MKSDEERSWAANRGYDDSAGLYYGYDSNVSNSRQVSTGDLIVVRVDDYVAGWGVVEGIDVDLHATKEIRRCPSCRRTQWRERANSVPHVICDDCKVEFELPDLLIEVVPVVSFRAHYAGTWTEAVRPVSRNDPLLTGALKTGDTFNAIRPLEEALLAPLLDWISGGDSPVRGLFTHQVAALLAGGHTLGMVRRRIGQREFRFKMMERFGEKCAFSGAQPPHTLEAAHLYSYAQIRCTRPKEVSYFAGIIMHLRRQSRDREPVIVACGNCTVVAKVRDVCRGRRCRPAGTSRQETRQGID
jgi:hypothetical protein